MVIIAILGLYLTPFQTIVLQEMEEENFVITVDMFIKLLNMYIEIGKLDKTLNAYEILCKKISQFEFDSVKLLKIVHLLVSDNQVDSKLGIIE